MNDKLLNVGPGLVLGIPTLGRPVPAEWAFALKSLNPPINFNTIFHHIKGQEIGYARNEMALNAINVNAKYLFFLGDDVVVPEHTLRSMIYKMDQREDIGVIGGVYCAKANPAFPLVFRGNGQGSYWDWKIGEFFECTGLGMDCTILRVSLLKELHEKGGELFKTVKKDQFLDGINSAEEWTEDLYFLNRVTNETKYKIYCDGGIICQHWDIYAKPPKYYTLPLDSLPMRQMVVDKDLKKLLDIGGNLPPQDGFSIVTAGDVEGVDYRCDPSALPFDSNSFDAVNMHIEVKTPSSFCAIINDIFRVLNVKGIFKFTYSNAYSKEWLAELIELSGFAVTKHDKCLIEAFKPEPKTT